MQAHQHLLLDALNPAWVTAQLSEVTIYWLHTYGAQSMQLMQDLGPTICTASLHHNRSCEDSQIVSSKLGNSPKTDNHDRRYYPPNPSINPCYTRLQLPNHVLPQADRRPSKSRVDASETVNDVHSWLCPSLFTLTCCACSGCCSVLVGLIRVFEPQYLPSAGVGRASESPIRRVKATMKMSVKRMLEESGS